MVDVPFEMAIYTGHVRFYGTWHVGDLITISWSGYSVTSPCGSFVFAFQLFLQDYAYAEHPFHTGSVPTSIGELANREATHLDVVFYTDSYCSTGTVFNVTVTGGSLDPTGTPCIYGTEKQEPGASIVQITPAILGVLLPSSGWWALPLAVASIGASVSLDTLCSGPAVLPQELEPSDFTTYEPPYYVNRAARKVGFNIQNLLWHKFCKCQEGPLGEPGGGGTTIWNISKPTWYIDNSVHNVSNTDIAATLNFYFNYTAGQTSIQQSTEAAATLQSRCPPRAYIDSTVHEGLVADGSFEFSDVVGFKVEVTARPDSTVVLGGQPPYLWNQGWMSVLAEDLLLDERRITREGYLWFPCAIHLGTKFAYTLPDFTELRVTELVAPPEVVLDVG